MSRGNGTSGFSPVSTVGMFAFLISFSTNPVENDTSMFCNSLRQALKLYHFLKSLHVHLKTKCEYPDIRLFKMKDTFPLKENQFSLLQKFLWIVIKSVWLTQLSIHLLTTPHFIHKLPLEHIHIRVELQKGLIAWLVTLFSRQAENWRDSYFQGKHCIKILFNKINFITVLASK